MKLSELIENVKVKKIIGSQNLDIKDVVIDSKQVKEGSLFICLSGTGYDGHDFIRQAENYGATAVVCEKECESRITEIVVENTRTAMGVIAANFYGNADKQLKILGVTGTNGKTTTTYIIKSILDKAGIKCGVIGTLGVCYDGKLLESPLTTPDPIMLHSVFADMVKCGVKIVVMEVSAHALYWEKVEGINFEVGIFTNLTQDHLDFFTNLEDYKLAKFKLFFKGKCKYIVSNSDDTVGLEIINGNFGKVFSYGIDNPADVFAVKIKETTSITEYFINVFDCILEIKTVLMGKFNVYNALAAATACALIGVKPEKIAEGLSEMKNVSGRMEKVYAGDFNVYIDYAHTPDGLLKSLSSLRKISSNRLISVFGCGGNRDKGKRSIMGKISGTIADFTVITSDNPRFEEPMAIISEIEKGMLEVSKSYVIVQNRAEAIKYALEYAKTGDTVLIAGKGSEKYQEVLGVKHVFSDKETVLEILGK